MPSLPVTPLLAGLGAVLGLAALAPVGALRLALFSAASGIAPFLLARRRWTASELLVTPVVTSTLVWSVIGTLMVGPALRALAPWVPAIVAGTLASIAWRRRRRIEVGLSAADAAPLVAVALAAVPVCAVLAHNGLEGDHYVAHGFFALDTFYLFALAQESVVRGGWPTENPFLAGVYNHYPSFSHVGLGALASQGSPTVAISLPWLAPWFLVASVGLWVAACVRAATVRSAGDAAMTAAIALVGVGGVVGLRPDLFVYPHTQAFALGWLALMLWLAAEPADTPSLAAAVVVALGLVMAHTVTGAAGVTFVAGTAVTSWVGRETRRRGFFLGGASLVLLLVLWGTSALPYGGPRGPFTLAGLAAPWHYLRAWVWPMAGLALALVSSWRSPGQMLPALGAVALGALYYLHGSMLLETNERVFVIFNGERFLLLGLLLGLLPAVRGDRRIGLAAVLLMGASALWRPTDLARAAKEKLIDEPPRVIDASELGLYDRMRRELPVDARIIVASPDKAMPAFTGRAQSPAQANNIWGLNTLSPDEFDRRVDAVLGLSSLPTAEWPPVFDRWAYTHLLFQPKLPPGMDPTSARAWVEAKLPPGELTVQMSSGPYFLIARTPHNR